MVNKKEIEIFTKSLMEMSSKLYELEIVDITIKLSNGKKYNVFSYSKWEEENLKE